MRTIDRILIVQTAFLGDVVLTLPLVQVVRQFFAFSKIDVVVVPRAADLVRTHPDIHQVIEYDKRGADRGLSGFLKLLRRIRSEKYGLALVPHRSLRSAFLVTFAGIPLRIGFDRSTGRWLFSKTVRYRQDLHEIERNISLLEAIGIRHHARELPKLFPTARDVQRVDRLLFDLELLNPQQLVAIAPGTIWNTKRWLKERYAELAARLADERYEVILIGGEEDKALCREIKALSGSSRVYTTAGALSTLQSAELLRRCKLLITNDSAPMHFAVAVGTPVVAIFGATVPEFGFAPYGKHDTVVETLGLSCRPCSIHGGRECPIKTFECMNAITVERVYRRVEDVMARAATSLPE
jgi:heptosyltransferase-2